MAYLAVLGRIVVVIPLFILVSVVMGKRHVGELSVFDLVITVTLGSVVGADLADPQVPHGPTLMTVAALGGIHWLISRMVVKNRRFGRLVTFDPTIVIQNGQIVRDNLVRVRYSVDELLGHLREKDVFDLDEVEFAVLESNGVLSVLKRSQHRPPKTGELGLDTDYEGLATPLILEGKINTQGLSEVSLSQQWLTDRLSELGYGDPGDIFLAMLNTKGELYVAPNHPGVRRQRLDH